MAILKTVLPTDPPPATASRSSRRSAWRRYRWWLGGLIGLGLAGAAGLHALAPKTAASAKDGGKPVSALTVTTAAAERGAIPRSLMITGSLAARDELPIGTETTGLAISEVLVDIGDSVKRGQLLVRFNDQVLRAQLQQAQASLNEAEANVVEADANARRAEELTRTGWMSGKDFDNRRATALGMAARVGVAKANLALAQAKLKQAELRAPADGTITARTARLGAVVLAGNIELFRMIRDDRVELIAEVPETDLALVKVGQSVSLSVDGDINNHSNNGVIRLIEPTVDVKTRIGRVRVDVEKDAGLLPGMFVTGKVALGQTDAVVVPEQAVVYLDGKPAVFIVDAAGKSDSRSVVLGPRHQGRVAVLSGLTVGERLVLRGAGYLKSGDQVTVVEPPPNAGSAPIPLAN